MASTQSTSDFLASRYFERNSEQKYFMNILNFMLWKKGKFILPNKKYDIIEQYKNEEIENFFSKGIINIPQLQFLVTTRCTLRCKNCNAYIPNFGKNGIKHIEISPEYFQKDMDALAQAVTHIRRFILIGGEPLLHPKLSHLIRTALSYNMISTIEIITNGTLVPRDDVLDVCENNNERVYFHISNYSANISLEKHLRHEKIFSALKCRNIKYQMSDVQIWKKEIPFQGCNDIESTQKLFGACWLKRCVQILDGKIAVCPKASAGYALAMIDGSQPGEQIDVRSCADLRQELISFYAREYFEACRSCARIDENVPVAEQY